MKHKQLGDQGLLGQPNILDTREVNQGLGIDQGENIHIAIVIDRNQQIENLRILVKSLHLKEKDRELEITGRENLGPVQRKEDREEKDILPHHPKHLHSVMPAEWDTAAEEKEEILMYLVHPKNIAKDQDPELPFY